MRLRVNGSELELPGLSMANVERFQADGTLEKPLPSQGVAFLVPEYRANGMELIHAALPQDHPEVTMEQLKAAITTQNGQEAVEWVIGKRPSDVKGEAPRP